MEAGLKSAVTFRSQDELQFVFNCVRSWLYNPLYIKVQNSIEMQHLVTQSSSQKSSDGKEISSLSSKLELFSPAGTESEVLMNR